MDFGAGSADDIHFYYVVPFSPRSALVETTHFSKKTGSVDQYETELRHYLKHRYGLARWQVKHTEQGVLPMAKRGQKRAQRADCDALSLGLHGVQLSRLPDIVFLTLKTKRRRWPFG